MKKDELRSLIHDLNNQISIIQLQNTLAIKVFDRDPNETIKHLIKMKTSIDKIQGILQDSMTVDEEVLKFKEELFSHKLDFQDVYGLTLTITGDTDIEVRCKKTDIYRVFENIVKNAKEASAKSIIVHFNENGILFSDDGLGLTKDVLEKLNNSEQITTKEKGHGLGTQCIRNFCSDNSFSLQFANKRKNLFSDTEHKGTHIILKKIGDK